MKNLLNLLKCNCVRQVICTFLLWVSDLLSSEESHSPGTCAYKSRSAIVTPIYIITVFNINQHIADLQKKKIAFSSI